MGTTPRLFGWWHPRRSPEALIGWKGMSQQSKTSARVRALAVVVRDPVKTRREGRPTPGRPSRLRGTVQLKMKKCLLTSWNELPSDDTLTLPLTPSQTP